MNNTQDEHHNLFSSKPLNFNHNFRIFDHYLTYRKYENQNNKIGKSGNSENRPLLRNPKLRNRRIDGKSRFLVEKEGVYSAVESRTHQRTQTAPSQYIGYP